MLALVSFGGIEVGMLFHFQTCFTFRRCLEKETEILENKRTRGEKSASVMTILASSEIQHGKVLSRSFLAEAPSYEPYPLLSRSLFSRGFRRERKSWRMTSSTSNILTHAGSHTAMDM
jgi:hypothetical protein